MERPPRRDNPIALTGHIADLENQLYPGRRQPRGAGIRNYPSDGSDAYAAPLRRNMRIRLIAPIFRRRKRRTRVQKFTVTSRSPGKISNRSVISTIGWRHIGAVKQPGNGLSPVIRLIRICRFA